jgi:hypothetical protein
MSGAGIPGDPYIINSQSSIRTESANYPALLTDGTILVRANTSDVTVTLPAPAPAGKIYYIKIISITSTFKVNITAAGGKQVEGLSQISGSLPYQGWVLQCDANGDWYIISRI